MPAHAAHRALVLTLLALALAGAAPRPKPKAPLTPPEALAFGDDYRTWLGRARTPALAVEEVRTLALAHGFRVLDPSVPPEGWPRLAPGDGVLIVVDRRTAILARIGTRPLADGLRIAAAHIDAPSLRLEPRAPAGKGKDSLGAVLLAHAYGGLKPYQWSGLPLVVTGIVAPVHGLPIHVTLGEDDGYTFLLEPRAPEALVPVGPAPAPPRAEEAPVFRILAASATLPKDAKGGAAARFWAVIQESHGLTAADLEAAELYAVPAGAPRDAGLDRAYVLAAGQDDRACSYAALRAILDAATDARIPAYTSMAILVDREEMGSTGVSGMRSARFDLAVHALLEARGEPATSAALAATFRASRVLSADVKAGVSPIFPEVHDLKNAPVIGRGPTIVKATGHGGKSGASDASPELGRFVRAAAARAGVPTQSSESGKVDEGGGGTVAKFLAARGMDVIDVGVPVLSMHAPHELSAKVDVWNLARLVRAFHEAP